MKVSTRQNICKLNQGNATENFVEEKISIAQKQRKAAACKVVAKLNNRSRFQIWK
jgi:hypothetical protein